MRASVFVVAALFAAANVVAQAPPPALEYDSASEVTLRGEVTQTHESKVVTDHPGLHLLLKTDNEAVEVHACPVRFLNELEFKIEPGDKLTVTGSRQKEPPLIVAREIRKGQLSLILRDKNGAPNWQPR